MKKINEDIVVTGKIAAAGVLATALAFGNVQSTLADAPDNLPKQYFLDDAGVVQKANGGYAEKVRSRHPFLFPTSHPPVSCPPNRE